MLGMKGGKWYLLAPLLLEGLPHDPCLSGLYTDMNRAVSLLSVPCIFQTSGSMLYLHGLFVMLSF